MINPKKTIEVTHINIRQSISFLVIKLIVLELIAGTVVISLYWVLLTDVLSIVNLHGSFTQPFFMLILIFGVIIKLLFTIYIVIEWLNEYYEISAEEISYRKGVLFKREENHPFKNLHFIEVNQGVFGRLFNYGTIEVLNIRRYLILNMYQIHNPMRYAKLLEKLIPDSEAKTRKIRSKFIEDKEEEDDV